MFLGTYDIDEYVAIPAATHRFSSGAAYQPTALTYSIYEEGGTTGLDEDVDMTPASPFDSITGAYLARRQLTAAAGFERGKTYVAIVKATVDSVAAVEMHVFQVRAGQTGDAYARLGAPAGASVSADIATRLATSGYTAPPSASDIKTALEADGSKLDHLWEMTEDDAGTRRFTENALEQAPTAGGSAPTVEQIRAEMDANSTKLAAILADTNELQTDLANGGRLDLLIDAIKAKTDNLPADPADQSAVEAAITAATSPLATAAALDAVGYYVDTEVAAILADTNELQTDLANGGRLDLLIDAIKAKTDNLPADPADQSAVEAAITAATSPLATAAALDAVGYYVDTEVAAIKAVTDKLDSAVELDGEVYRFTTNALEQAPSGSGLDAAGVRAAIGLASANLDTQLDALPTAAQVADAVWDEVLDTAHEVAGSASVLLQASGAAGDPMSVAVPGAYAEGTAGYVIGHLESSGSGSVYWPYTVTDSATGNPIEGVTVSVSTDIAGSVVVASGTTNASGVVNFNLDPGTYYLWLSKTGYTFTNPDTEVIA